MLLIIKTQIENYASQIYKQLKTFNFRAEKLMDLIRYVEFSNIVDILKS